MAHLSIGLHNIRAGGGFHPEKMHSARKNFSRPDYLRG
jgi:hypothetical protein